jgi:N-hydroxyarylamine O-acetyltransferase
VGFQTQAAMARVLTRPNPRPVFSHRATIVTIGQQRFLADVGFGGPMPAFASLMVDGASRTEHGQTFTMHELDENWWEVGYTSVNHNDWRVMRVCTMPVEEHDFIPLSFYQSQNPQSAFRLHRIVNIKTEDGAYGLRDLTFTEFKGGEQTQREIREDELDQVLEEAFGIVNWR